MLNDRSKTGGLAAPPPTVPSVFTVLIAQAKLFLRLEIVVGHLNKSFKVYTTPCCPVQAYEGCKIGVKFDVIC